MSEQNILEIVKRYLDQNRPEGVAIEVVERGLRRDGDWWYVPVRMPERLVRQSHYYDALADAEIEIKDNEHVEVLFVPTA